jgi:hypothetical protein
MNLNPLGRLEKVGLREAWLSESNHFTPWLAQCDNLELLGEAIGIQLECEAQEKNVGPFRADILCKDGATEHWVLIENQLERTDHNHLGQLLTYAAGLEAVTIVWIAERFTDEHRAALDWLNQHTDEAINFFGLEVELWRIGNSAPAPKFNVVCKPNEWTRSIAESAKQIEAGPVAGSKLLQLQFWTQFREHMDDSQSSVKATKPLPQHWMNIYALGRAGFKLMATLSTAKDRIGVSLVMKDPNKTYFHHLKGEISQIEKEVGCSLEWQELPGKIESRIAVRRSEINAEDQSTWPAWHTWLQERLEIFQKVFGPRVRKLEGDVEVGVENEGE